MRKERRNGNLTAAAGEYFVAAELSRRGFVAERTGLSKDVDIVARHEQTGAMLSVQVKSLYTNNSFPISHAKVRPDVVYVFVLLQELGTVQYYIVPGCILRDRPGEFGPYFTAPSEKTADR